MSLIGGLRSLRPKLHFAALTHELPALVNALADMGLGTIVDYAREHRPAAEATEVASVIAGRMNEFPNAMHALKLSALGSEDDHAEAERHARVLAMRARELRTSVCVDAEENALHAGYSRTAFDLMREANALADDPDRPRYPTVFKTYQMYRADAVDELTKDIEMSRELGFELGAKLVRGAYLRLDRNSGALLPNKPMVDKSYERGLEIALQKGNGHVSTLIATRNIDNIEQALEHENNHRVLYAQLLGMDDDVTNRLVEKKMKVLKYVPFGRLSELSPYLYRRLLERLHWS
ncbi:Proline oxidase [Ostreococcus tauri]|uniref:Proline dehydrogenase n=1 Tax=Ostreococcus tauri TaxID=70448 RepID=A0A090N371_OSTTA|nr:Proline oxidase [Ostreococcus tauri]CEF97608.1 Proline oxidase [Ostreococcus tauri]|eukprot:XP_022838784.1 Proline oxidase [Ostreococcus tauri]